MKTITLPLKEYEEMKDKISKYDDKLCFAKYYDINQRWGDNGEPRLINTATFNNFDDMVKRFDDEEKKELKIYCKKLLKRLRKLEKDTKEVYIKMIKYEDRNILQRILNKEIK